MNLKNENTEVAPILKWAGGKRQLLPEIFKYIPSKYSAYYEPFLGGGAVLFQLLPQKAFVNDTNEELINLYEVIRDDVDNLIEDLKKHKNSSEYFYDIRSIDRDEVKYKEMTKIRRASRILYMNKVCYNGLYRVNQKGYFNTPFGKYKNPKICNEILLRKLKSYFTFANIVFTCLDFEEAVKGIRKDDFVYFDPPYDPLSESSNFTSYEKEGFGKHEQIRLRNLCDKLNDAGVRFLLSNSSTDFIKDLYRSYKIEYIQASRVINSKATERNKIQEVLIRNYV